MLIDYKGGEQTPKQGQQENDKKTKRGNDE
jgi:hypothetical protein